MPMIDQSMPKNLVEVTDLINHPSRLCLRDILTQYLIAEFYLQDDIKTEAEYEEFLTKIQTGKVYKYLSSIVPISHTQILAEFRKNASVIVDRMLEYQLGNDHNYVEPTFRLRKECNQETSEDGGEPISDIKKHIFQNSSKKIFLLIADSGIGKTTFLWWLNKYILEKNIEKVPIYLHSNDLDTTDWTSKLLKELVRTEREADSTINKPFLYSNEDSIKNFINITGQNKNLILLIDGLNESRSSDFDKNVKNNFTGNLKILTTREEYVKEFEHQNPNIPIEKIYITPFNTENISEYLGKDYNKLKVQIDKNKALFRIPIVLRFAYDIYKSRGHFNFKNKFDLYNQIIKEVKENQKKKPQVNSISFNDLIEMLPYVSFRALSKGIIKKIDEKGMHKHFLAKTCKEYSNINPYLQNVKDVIDSFKKNDSIFGIFNRKEGLFEYYHHSFQEFFTAYYLREQPIDKIKQYLYHPLFKEVLIFLGGGLETDKLKELIRFLIHEVHGDFKEKKIKKLAWKNLEIASLLIKESQERELLIKFFWNELEEEEIALKIHLDSEYYLNKIIAILENLYGIKISPYAIKDEDSIDTKVLYLLIGRRNNCITLKQEIIACIKKHFEIDHVTFNFVIDNDLQDDSWIKNALKDYIYKNLFHSEGFIHRQMVQNVIRFDLQRDLKVKKLVKDLVIQYLLDEDEWKRSDATYMAINLGLQNDFEIESKLRDSIIKNLSSENANVCSDAVNNSLELNIQNDVQVKERLKVAIIKDLYENYRSLFGIFLLTKESLENTVVNCLSGKNIDIDYIYHAVKLALFDNSKSEKFKDSTIKELSSEDIFVRADAINNALKLNLQNDIQIKEILKNAIIEDLYDEDGMHPFRIIPSATKEKLENTVANCLSGENIDIDYIYHAVKLALFDNSKSEKFKDSTIKELSSEDIFVRADAINNALKLNLQNDIQIKEILKNAIIEDLYDEDIEATCRLIDSSIELELHKNPRVRERIQDIIIQSVYEGDYSCYHENCNDCDEDCKYFEAVDNDCRKLLDIAVRLNMTTSIASKLLEIIKNSESLDIEVEKNFLIFLEKLDFESSKIFFKKSL